MVAGSEIFARVRGPRVFEILTRLTALNSVPSVSAIRETLTLRALHQNAVQPDSLHLLSLMTNVNTERPFAASLGGRTCLRPLPGRPEPLVLIVGGTGGLGSQLALWLARCGVRHFCLASRSGVCQVGRAIALAFHLNPIVLAHDVHFKGSDCACPAQGGNTRRPL
jgi:hypothetical protein